MPREETGQMLGNNRWCFRALMRPSVGLPINTNKHSLDTGMNKTREPKIGYLVGAGTNCHDDKNILSKSWTAIAKTRSSKGFFVEANSFSMTFYVSCVPIANAWRSAIRRPQSEDYVYYMKPPHHPNGCDAFFPPIPIGSRT